MAGCFLSFTFVALVCVSVVNGRSIRSVAMCNPPLPTNKVEILREAERREANGEITYDTVRVSDYMVRVEDNSESLTCGQDDNLLSFVMPR